MKNTVISPLLRFALACLVVVPIGMATPTHSFAQQTASINRGPSGLALPRFVSLKSKRVNMRVGPGKDYAVSWMYLKSGLPLEIIQEFDNWRRVRDSEGTTGWIHGSLLSGNRTAIVSPWRKATGSETVTLYKNPQRGAKAVAFVQPGVIADIENCDGVWCEIQVSAQDKKLNGYTSQVDLWGAYPDEPIKDD